MPEYFRSLSSLTILHLNGCEMLDDIPDGICKLFFLQTLWFANCKLLRKGLEDFGNLSSLEIVNLQGCKNLKGKPKILCKLKVSQKIYLNDCKVLNLLPKDFQKSFVIANFVS